MSKTFLCSLLCMLPVVGIAATDPDLTGMNVTAQTWCKHVTAGWNLGNTLESQGASWDNDSWSYYDIWESNYLNWETSWGQPKTTKAMIDGVKAAGFNAIRVPVQWWAHITDYDNMTIDAEWLARVKEVIDYCVANDLYVILNAHHESWLEYNPVYSLQSKINTHLTKLWTNIATAFADYDYHLAFAGTNEVQINWQTPTEENLAVQNSYNQTFVDAVRATGGKNYYRHLIIQTYSCNPYYGISGLKIPTDVVDNRLSVEFHYYDPSDYCSDGHTVHLWGEPYAQYGKISTSGEGVMQLVFKQMYEKFYQKGLGVVIGEYGAVINYENDVTPADSIAIYQANQQYYYKTLTQEAHKYGFAAFAWDISMFEHKGFGILKRSNDNAVENTYAMNGILEGAAQTFVASDIDPLTTTIWTGSRTLDYGTQFALSSHYFAFANEGTTLAITYQPIEYWAQVFVKDTWWGDFTSVVEGVEISSSTNFDNTCVINDDGSHTITLTFTGSDLSKVKERGIGFTGHGLLTSCILTLVQEEEEQPSEQVDSEITLWEGSTTFDWQHSIYIQSSNFAHTLAGSTLYVTYDFVADCSYTALQFLDGNWSHTDMTFTSGATTGYAFSPSTLEGSNTGSHTTAFTLSAEALALMQTTSGLNMQGYGITVTKVTLKKVPGDVNQDGYIDIADLLMLQAHLAGQLTLSDTSTADINGDGYLNATDLVALQNKILK